MFHTSPRTNKNKIKTLQIKNIICETDKISWIQISISDVKNILFKFYSQINILLSFIFHLSLILLSLYISCVLILSSLYTLFYFAYIFVLFIIYYIFIFD